MPRRGGQGALTSRFLRFSAHRAEEFLQRGFPGRRFFPHDVYVLPKCGPDGWKLSRRMCDASDLSQAWEVVLFAAPELVRRFPRELFFDDDLVWHRQHFGKAGQIATANLVLRGRTLHSMVHVSDLVQRIGRRREHKTQVENRFKGWPHLLLHTVLSVADRSGVDEVFVPTAEWALRNTDAARAPRPELFQRVYDRSVHEPFRAERRGRWWRLDVTANRDRLVAPEVAEQALAGGATVCVCHDVEGGSGHVDTDPRLADLADARAERHLEAMLEAEADAGVHATYQVVGRRLSEVRRRIESGGHCLSFHSYDHTDATAADSDGAADQLARCREVDYRIKGYRPPRSSLTPELSDENLCWHNFEWLASSAWSFGFDQPVLRGRVAKLPILFDDFALYAEEKAYDVWERETLAALERRDLVVFSTHDCYAHLWLPRYRELLAKLRDLATFETLDELAARTTLAEAALTIADTPRHNDPDVIDLRGRQPRSLAVRS